jgi:pyruvate-formate lyase-activating enzyme
MLTGVHFILIYMCTYECDHCFLSCSPWTQGTFTHRQVEDVLRELQKIGTVEAVSFEGGEPFLFHPLLAASIRSARQAGFKTAIETNTYWATTEADAELWLQPLVDAGLSMLEVSDDAFHHEDEYVDACHMCSKLCLALVQKFPRLLAPGQVYGLE